MCSETIKIWLGSPSSTPSTSFQLPAFVRTVMMVFKRSRMCAYQPKPCGLARPSAMVALVKPRRRSATVSA
jgi:hypothetical protein